MFQRFRSISCIRHLLLVSFLQTSFSNFLKLQTGDDPIKLFFLRFFFFGVKLGHFTINNFFLYITKTQAYQQKTEKFFVSEEFLRFFTVKQSNLMVNTFFSQRNKPSS
jgi:hypothetical protein